MNTIDAIVNIARGTDIFKVCVCQIDYSNDEHALTDEVGCYMFHRCEIEGIGALENQVK